MNHTAINNLEGIQGHVAVNSTPQHFTGRYIALKEISIEYTDNKLIRVTSGKPDVELKPESATKFFYADGTDRQIEFKMDAGNNVVHALLTSNGRTAEYLKKY